MSVFSRSAGRIRNLVSFQKCCLQRASTSAFETSDWAQSELVITDRCVEQLKNIAKNGEHLRIMVDGGGCSGYEYKFDLDREIKSDDKIFERNGVKIVVDELSLDFMRGATIDYKEELIKSAFKIADNPLAEKGCSCGISFSLKDKDT